MTKHLKKKNNPHFVLFHEESEPPLEVRVPGDVSEVGWCVPWGRYQRWIGCWGRGGCVEIIGQIVEGQSIHQSGLTHNTEKNTPHQCLMTTSTGRKKVNYTSTVLVLISTKTQLNMYMIDDFMDVEYNTCCLSIR